jgi:large subunit ribosomal protein L18
MGKREKKQIRGTSSRPRLCVYRSNNHIYAQVVDDSTARTVLSCSTTEANIKSQISNTANQEASTLVGKLLGEKLLANNIKEVIFDRKNRQYHGRLKALAEGVRTTGVIL